MLLSVGRAGKAGGGFVAAHLEVRLHRGDRRQGTAHNHYLQTVGKRGAGDVAGVRSVERQYGEQKSDKGSRVFNFKSISPGRIFACN